MGIQGLYYRTVRAVCMVFVRLDQSGDEGPLIGMRTQDRKVTPAILGRSPSAHPIPPISRGALRQRHRQALQLPKLRHPIPNDAYNFNILHDTVLALC